MSSLSAASCCILLPKCIFIMHLRVVFIPVSPSLYSSPIIFSYLKGMIINRRYIIAEEKVSLDRDNVNARRLYRLLHRKREGRFNSLKART